MENPISLEEIKKAILRAKLGKATGCDDLRTEVLTNDTATLSCLSYYTLAMSLVSYPHFGEKELLTQSIKITLWIPMAI